MSVLEAHRPDAPERLSRPREGRAALAPEVVVGKVRWYVRGTNEPHEYDLSVATQGRAFCRTCLVTHARPIGADWHIEASTVDFMLCGVVIGLDEGEVRLRPSKNICAECARIAAEEDEA